MPPDATPDATAQTHALTDVPDGYGPTLGPGDADYHAIELGAGRPIVLLHDALNDHTSFAPLFDAIADDARIVAFDLPGHGASTALDRERTPDLAAFVDEFGGVVDDVCGQPAVLVGHGMSATIAVALAAARPARAAAVICVAGLPWATATLAQAWTGDPEWLDDHFADRYSASYFRQHPGATADDRARMAGLAPEAVNPLLTLPTGDTDAAATLDALRIGVEFVHGTADGLVAVRAVEQFAAAVERPLHLLPGIGHGVPVEATAELAGIIRDRIG